jgi:TRAP-type C4-dicarboxylate transport system permease small subunit
LIINLIGIDKQVTIGTFDWIGSLLLALAFGFSLGVAASSWEWFPTKGDWGDIAHIPPTLINYTALLLPWFVLLVFLLVRRLGFKQKSKSTS